MGWIVLYSLIFHLWLMFHPGIRTNATQIFHVCILFVVTKQCSDNSSFFFFKSVFTLRYVNFICMCTLLNLVLKCDSFCQLFNEVLK